MTIIIGCDPGLSGACAALLLADDEGPEFVMDAIDLPVMPDGKKNQIDDFALATWLQRVGKPTKVVIENVQPMPSIPGKGSVRRSMGAASSFRFGVAVGQVRSTLRAVTGLEPEFVHPQVWKRWFGLPGADKEAARQLALALWPASDYLLRRKMDHQRAEAMLLAKYGARPVIGRNR